MGGGAQKRTHWQLLCWKQLLKPRSGRRNLIGWLGRQWAGPAEFTAAQKAHRSQKWDLWGCTSQNSYCSLCHKNIWSFCLLPGFVPGVCGKWSWQNCTTSSVDANVKEKTYLVHAVSILLQFFGRSSKLQMAPRMEFTHRSFWKSSGSFCNVIATNVLMRDSVYSKDSNESNQGLILIFCSAACCSRPALNFF